MAESLRGALSLTVSGFAFASHDIGGFEVSSAGFSLYPLLMPEPRDTLRLRYTIDGSPTDCSPPTLGSTARCPTEYHGTTAKRPPRICHASSTQSTGSCRTCTSWCVLPPSLLCDDPDADLLGSGSPHTRTPAPTRDVHRVPVRPHDAPPRPTIHARPVAARRARVRSRGRGH